MPARQGTHRRPRRPIGDVTDPEGLGALAEAYLEALRVRNASPRTVENIDKSLRIFVEWSEARSLRRPVEVTKPILERYQRHLFHFRTESGARAGRPLSFRTQHIRLGAVRGFFRWLARQNHILGNPASELELPKLGHRLPGAVLTKSEVEKVLAEASPASAVGLRDRAILETLYATGVRRSELVSLRLYDVDRERGTLMVRQGKGRKDRMIPIGERALGWIARYLDEARPGLMVPPDEGYLFLTTLGERLTPDFLTQSVRRYVLAAGIGKSGSCHLFRHTMATLMLEGGADVRYIQEMLGHAHLDSTEVYTRVSIRKLQAIYAATHPAAKGGVERRNGEDGAAGDDGTAELFSLLAAEGDAETAEDEGGV
jgi:integrase/recombinase XerD